MVHEAAPLTRMPRMNQFLHGVARAIAETFDLPEPILEIGSYQVPGQQELANLRPLFPHKEFLGVDCRPGPGVDYVASAEELPFHNGTFGTVIAMSTFEHVPRFWRGFEEAHRVLRPDGALLVACPFYFYIHSFPSDFWRFTPQALELLLESFPSKLFGWHGAAKRPANVWALAFREEADAISGEEFDAYRERLRLYARQPLSQSRRLRYAMARLFCGRGPFAPYLDQDKWETQCQTEVCRKTRKTPTLLLPSQPSLAE
jgi:SAM-dependent methyltransferase